MNMDWKKAGVRVESLCLLSVLTLSACVTSTEPIEPRRPPAERAVACDGPMVPGRGRVWFYRMAPRGAGVPWNFVLDDELSGVILPDRCYCADVVPGAHQVSIEYIGNRSIEFSAEPGRVQYIRFDIDPKLFGKRGVWPVLVDQDTGQKELGSRSCADRQ